MRSTRTRGFLPIVPVLCALVLVALDSAPALAQGPRCFQTLRDCYGRAATREGWFDMWLAGMDCELDFVDCARRQIVGS